MYSAISLQIKNTFHETFPIGTNDLWQESEQAPFLSILSVIRDGLLLKSFWPETSSARYLS